MSPETKKLSHITFICASYSNLRSRNFWPDRAFHRQGSYRARLSWDGRAYDPSTAAGEKGGESWPGQGPGKGREGKRKPEGLEAHMVGGGALIFPDPPWLVLPALALAKSLSQRCPQGGCLGLVQGCIRGLCKGQLGTGDWGSACRPRGAREGRLSF